MLVSNIDDDGWYQQCHQGPAPHQKQNNLIYEREHCIHIHGPFFHEPKANSTDQEDDPTQRKEQSIPNSLNLTSKNKIKREECSINCQYTYERDGRWTI